MLATASFMFMFMWRQLFEGFVGFILKKELIFFFVRGQAVPRGATLRERCGPSWQKVHNQLELNDINLLLAAISSKINFFLKRKEDETNDRVEEVICVGFIIFIIMLSKISKIVIKGRTIKYCFTNAKENINYFRLFNLPYNFTE